MKRLLVLALSVVMIALVVGVSAGVTADFGPNVKVKNGLSTNWSGYAVQTSLTAPQSNAVSEVKGSWTVPAVADLSNAYSATWIGIDGYSSNTVEQIGTSQDWYYGVPRYTAWYEMYPKWPVAIRSLAVRPGDTISAEVKFIGKGKYTLTMANVTTGQTFSTTQRSNSAKRQSAEWIEEAPWSSGVLPLANFGTVYFYGSSATLNNHTGPVNDPAWQYDAITMVDNYGTIKALPSPLSEDGSSFSVTWYSH